MYDSKVHGSGSECLFKWLSPGEVSLISFLCVTAISFFFFYLYSGTLGTFMLTLDCTLSWHSSILTSLNILSITAKMIWLLSLITICKVSPRSLGGRFDRLQIRFKQAPHKLKCLCCSLAQVLQLKSTHSADILKLGTVVGRTPNRLPKFS